VPALRAIAVWGGPLLLVLCLAGCVTEGTAPPVSGDGPPSVPAMAGAATTGPDPTSGPAPASWYRIDDRLWSRAPDCVLVRVSAGDGGMSAKMVGRAAARQMSGHVDRVIGPDRLDQMAATLGFDPAHPLDRRRLDRLIGCGFVLHVAPAGGADWALIWTEARVVLHLRLVDLADDLVLWEAGHAARRGDGGLPLSPFSAMVAVAAAAALAGDRDLMPSLIDDALRGALASLPDLRHGLPTGQPLAWRKATRQ